MPHWKKMMDKDYLGSWDFEDGEGGFKEATLTITGVEKGTLKSSRGTDTKPVASFKETTKKMVLNATNCKSIASKHGNDTAAWVDAKITLYVTKVDVGGESMDAIRVRPK